MTRYLGGTISGWLGAIFTAGVALLPYLLRRSPLGMTLPSKLPYLRRMWPHYWLAYAATALSFLHAWSLMGRGMIRTSAVGLYLATGALLLMFLQVFLGLTLQQRNLPERWSVRRWHFWTMAAVIALLGAHVWMNG